MRDILADAAYAVVVTSLVAFAFLGPIEAMISLAIILGHIWAERRAFLGW